MTSPIASNETSASPWDSTPIGRSIYLRFCQHEQLSPQLIIEEKVIRSAIRLRNRSIIHLIGTLISDDESQRLTYVIDRLLLIDSVKNGIDNHQLLTGEFLIPVHCDKKSPAALNTSIQEGINGIDSYCRSSLPIEFHQYSYLCGHMIWKHSSPVNVDLSFDLLTISSCFALTPIKPDCIQILPTALLKNLNSLTSNTIYNNQPHFGYCSLDRLSTNQILFLLENDPQACTLPLLGIWISGIVDVQCPFVWAACVRYCMNSSLQQRLHSGIHSFLLICYLSTSRGQCNVYEVSLTTTNSISSFTINYDLWTCSKTIPVPNIASHQYDTSCDTEFPYDFQFQRVHHESKANTSPGVVHSRPSLPHTSTNMDTQFLPDVSASPLKPLLGDYQAILSSPNTNGSLFGFPRLPPKQSAIQSPSWDLMPTTPLTTPKRAPPPLSVSPKFKSLSSPTPLTNVSEDRWKAELIERMQSYEAHIQSLTTLVSQLLTAQTQQSSLLTPIKQCTKRDVAVQSEPSSPYVNDHVDESLSRSKRSQHHSPAPRIERSQQQSPLLTTVDQPLPTQFQLPMPHSVTHQQEPLIDYSSARSLSPRLSPSSPDHKSVDILKPIFQYIDNQQQKHQESTSNTETVLVQTNDAEPDHHLPEGVLHSGHTIQQQQQHVTSTRTTGISFISHGVQMQFINQQSSTTTVFPQTQPPSNELLPTSPQKSENNLSIEVHSLEMKYLEDEQLAAAIEYDRQSQSAVTVLPQTSQITDKSLSFETQEYLQRYGLFTNSTKSQ